MSARSVIVVPPLLKYPAGPLLGPAMLAAAAAKAGHRADVLDLNIRYLASRLGSEMGSTASRVVGDHDRPEAALRRIEGGFVNELAAHLPVPVSRGGIEPYAMLTFPMSAVYEAAGSLARGTTGSWIADQLALEPRPDVFAVSVLFSGQVLWGLAASIVAKRMWPSVPIFWGGAHVTALADEIAQDGGYGKWIDGFVFGHAERTFAALLDAFDKRTNLPAGVIEAGARNALGGEEDAEQSPMFSELHAYGIPRLTLPAQTSRGCGYGLCTFCTYPVIEGKYRQLDLHWLRPVIEEAKSRYAAVAFKDSLLFARRLDEIGTMIGGTIKWSGCTKLSAGLLGSLPVWAEQGLDTLEVGLETLTSDGQRLIQKEQSLDLFLRTLDAAEAAGIALVVNYITGLPNANPDLEESWLERVQSELSRRPALRSKLEHNRFQLERRSPLARSPGHAGIHVTGAWPWSSVLDWEPVQPSRRGRLLRVLRQS
jgi:hypothetical protein